MLSRARSAACVLHLDQPACAADITGRVGVRQAHQRFNSALFDNNRRIVELADASRRSRSYRLTPPYDRLARR
jgi:hypothetical protein